MVVLLAPKLPIGGPGGAAALPLRDTRAMPSSQPNPPFFSPGSQKKKNYVASQEKKNDNQKRSEKIHQNCGTLTYTV